MTSTSVLDALRDRAHDAAARSHAPYSRRPAGAAVLLADGAWLAGARVENAAFPLTIPAATAALAAARVAGVAADVRAVVLSHPFEAGEAEASIALVADALSPALTPAGDDALVTPGVLPTPSAEFSLALREQPPADDRAGLALAERMALRAHVPESGFPVGCVILTADARLYGGANVESSDWTRGLCAERVALASMVSSGARDVIRAWLACPRGPGCSPCGACRQVFAELAPHAEIVMARPGGASEIIAVAGLLPGAFDASQLA